MIWNKLSWQILDIVISWYGVSVVFSWLKKLCYSKMMWFFWTYQTVLIVLLFTFTHLPTLLMIIIKKCSCVNILWNHQQSSVQHCLSIDIFGQKYCDISSLYRLSCSTPWGKDTPAQQSCQSVVPDDPSWLGVSHTDDTSWPCQTLLEPIENVESASAVRRHR